MELALILLLSFAIGVFLFYSLSIIKKHHNGFIMDDDKKLEQSWHWIRAFILDELMYDWEHDLSREILGRLINDSPILWDIHEDTEPRLLDLVKKKCKVDPTLDHFQVFLSITQPHHDFVIGINSTNDKNPLIIFKKHEIVWSQFICRYLDRLLDNSTVLSNLGEQYNNVELADINSIARYISVDPAFFNHAELPIQIGRLLKDGENLLLGKKVKAISATKWEIEGIPYHYAHAIDHLTATYKQSSFSDNKMNEMLDEFF